MKYGEDITDKRCARCHQPVTVPMVYREGLWFHATCFSDGARQLSNATRLAKALEEPASSPSYPCGVLHTD